MLIQYSVLLAGLIVGTITDLRTREVPDWINYSMIAAGIGINALSALILKDYSIIIYSILGLAVFWMISHFLFYTGQWGGGDAKMLMGIGALLGIKITTGFPFIDASQMLVAFLVNMVIAGFLYGLAAAGYIAFMNKRKFLRRFKKDLERMNKIRIAAIMAGLLLILASLTFNQFYLKFGFAMLAITIIFSFYLWMFVKSVENSCMYKLVSPEKLTEGDWIARDIIINKKTIAGPKDLGIEKKQIAELIKLQKKGKVKKVLIKEGIPFVPSFLAAFIMSLLWGNVLLRFF